MVRPAHTFFVPNPFYHSNQISAISCVSLPSLVFLFLVSSLLCPAHALPNPALQAGWSPNSSEVILNGNIVEKSASDTFPSWQPFPDLYLWLSNSSQSPIVYSAIDSSSTTAYLTTVAPAAWLAVKDPTNINVYNVDDSQVEEQAVLVFTRGLCNVDISQTDVAYSFTLTTTADYDEVLVRFTHDCSYPRVRIGRPPATDDVIEYSSTRNPNLTPSSDVQLSVTANTGKELQLEVQVVDTSEGQWQRGQNVTFIVDMTSSDELTASTIVTPEPRTDQVVTIGTLLQSTPATITVASTCSDLSSSGSITLSINFGFVRPMTLPINVICQPQKGGNALTSLSVDLVLGSQYSADSTAVTRTAIAVNGAVPASSAFNVVPPAGQPYTFSTPQRYVLLSVYNTNPLNANITGRLTVSAGEWLVGLSGSSAARRGINVLSFVVQSSAKLSVLIETQCEYSQQLQSTTVLMDDITDGAGVKYDAVEFNYQWTCQQPPLFALSTRQPSGAQAAGNLIDQGQPARGASSDWTVDANGTAGVIDVNYNFGAPWTSVVGASLYLTVQSANATMFAWSLDRDASLGLSNAAFRLSGTSVQAGSAYKNNMPLQPAAARAELLTLDQLVCSKREYLQVSTRLTYGWTQYVTINFNRRCEQADRVDYVVEPLSGGAVAAIVLLVLLTAGCVMGCGWRYSSKGKRGWEVLPFHEWWSRVQDSALGPKRYTGPQMSDDLDIDGMTEEVEISSTGGYGSTSYQNDL